MSMALRRLAVSALAVAALAASTPAGVAAPTLPMAASPATATTTTSEGDRAIFVPVSPTRLLDTRTSGPALAAKGTRDVQVSGVAGVPADALAVVVNVTAVKPAKGGYLMAYPTGYPRPPFSNLHYAAGQQVANLATVKMGTGGRIGLYNGSLGLTHAVVDLAGYYRGHAHDDQYLPKAQAQARTADGAFTCAGGTVLQSVAADGAPTCVTDAVGETYTAGFGLLLDNGVFSAQQGRSAAGAFTCGLGQFLRAAAADGAPTCAVDQVGPTYTAGFGLSISGTTISAQQGRSAANAFTCPSGQYLRSVAADGTPTCAADVDTDTNTTYTAGSGLLLNGTQFSAAHGTTVVALRGDQAAATNGTALRNAMSAITDATAAKPYVISLAPGTYDLGTSAFFLKPHVSVVGAGRGATLLTGSHASYSSGLVNLGDNTTLARLSVTNTGTGTGWVTGVWAVGAVTARVAEVASTATQSAGETFGLLVFNGATVTAEDSSFAAYSTTGGSRGVYAVTSGATVRARSVDVVASGGASVYAVRSSNTAVVELTHGTVQGGVYREVADAALRIAHSKVDGAIVGLAPSCFGNYTSAYAAFTC